MPVLPASGEKYTIRRKVLKIFGAAFHIYDAQGQVIGYCKQAAFKLKEDLRIYTDESMQRELLRISARHIIDFGATYDIKPPKGTPSPPHGRRVSAAPSSATSGSSSTPKSTRSPRSKKRARSLPFFADGSNSSPSSLHKSM